jgi:2'-5' RNA ligase
MKSNDPSLAPKQIPLDGFGEPPKATDRLFFALYPEPPAKALIAQLAQRLRTDHGLHGQPLGTDKFHVTLHHLGDYAGLPNDIVEKARKAASAVAHRSFDVLFDHAASFARGNRNRPFVLQGDEGLASLMAFQKALGVQMAKAGLGREVEHSFTPHVTLLYDDEAVPRHPVDPVGWHVGEFVLVHSLIGQTTHLSLGSWPLNG